MTIELRNYNNHPENERCDQLATNTSYDNIDTITKQLNKKLK